MKREIIQKIGPLVSIILLICFGIYIYLDTNKVKNNQIIFESTINAGFFEQTAILKSKQSTKEKIAIQTKKAEDYKNKATQQNNIRINDAITKELPGIVCWGDSLTAGAGGKGTTFPKVLESMISKNVYPNIPVVNCGIGGEDSNTIIGRAGSIPFVVSKPFILPSDNSKIEISISSSNGSPVAPLRQGDCGLNPIQILGIDAQISIKQESSTSKVFYYFITRSKAGEAKEIVAGTKILSSGSLLYANFIPVIFIGQNGGWKDVDDLITQQMSIINSNKRNRDQFIILGLTSGDAKSRSELEKKELE
jgi:hypothetical protein